jgi:cell division septation protein DedD
MSDTLPPPLDPPGPIEPKLFDFPQPEPPPPATLSLDTAEVSATEALYQAAIGPVNTARYLPLFTRFEAADRMMPSWNWAASLCTLGWMLFRRMGMAALVYLALAATLLLAAGVLVALVFRGALELQWGVVLATALLLFLVPGILGDAWLHAHTRKRMSRALADSASWTEAAALLDRQAVGWPRAGWVALGHVALLVGAAALWLVVAGVPEFLVDGAAGERQVEEAVPRAAASAPASAAVADGTASIAAVPGATASASVASASASAPVSAPTSPSASAPAVSASASASAVAASAVVASAVRPAASTMAPSAMAAASEPAPARAPASTPASAAANAKSNAGAAVSRTPAQARAVEKPAASPGRDTAAASAPRPAARASVPPTAARPQLNVGLFAVESNARAAHARLRAAGLPATVEELQTRNGPRFRVRAGPFASRSAAEAAARRIRALGLEAELVKPSAASGR